MKFFKDNNRSNRRRDNKSSEQNINFKKQRLYAYIYERKRNNQESKYNNDNFNDVQSKIIHIQDIYK